MNAIAMVLCGSGWLGVIQNDGREQLDERVAVVGTRCSLGADIDQDGMVGLHDLLIVLESWGPCEDCRADFDQDGVIDFEDLLFLFSRWGPTAECPECDDGSDNDDDGLEDEADPGCWTNRHNPDTYDPERDNEAVATSQCQDGLDNDFDGKIDYPEDPGCGNPQVYTELERIVPGVPACADGIDNDNDGLIDWGATDGTDGFCSSPFDTSEQDVLYHPDHHAYIRWNDFPEFTVDNITMVYAGLDLHPTPYYPNRENFGTVPLQRGYTHLSGSAVDPDDLETLPFAQRAEIYGAGHPWVQDPILDEPWTRDRIPWGNDITKYRAYWQRTMARLADRYLDTRGSGRPRVNLMTLDIERTLHHDQQILELCSNELVPPQYRDLCRTDPDAFLYEYKVAMAELYFEALSYARQAAHRDTQISSYTDVVLHTSTVSYNGINSFSWEEWTSDMSLANYILLDFTAESMEEYYDRLGPFYHWLDYISSSAYLSKDYPEAYSQDTRERWEKAGGYLADILFRADANTAWMPDGTVNTPHIWNRYHTSSERKLHGLRPWMSHAMAIFVHFSENAGGWVFDSDNYHALNEDRDYAYVTDEMQAENRIAYDNMTYGLYRLAPYGEFFGDQAEVYHPMNARDLHRDKVPVWRGRWLNGRMLVAAHNPYAAPDQVTQLIITDPQQRVLGVVVVHGLNTWLGVCDLENGCVGDEGGHIE